MPAPKKSVVGYIAKQVAKKVAKKPVVKVQPKPNLKANPKSNVKVVKKEGPLSAKATEARRVRDAKYRIIELKNPRPKFELEDVPKGVSNRFDATNKRLAAEAAKKKKK